MKKRIAIAAAGTGGHVFPGLAVGKIFLDQGVHPLWFGTPGGLENQWVDKSQYSFYALNMRGVRGKGLVRWLLMPFALWMAVLEAKEILAKEKVEKVLLCGGYVTVPVGLAARYLKIPFVILEQNAAVGLSNRILSYFAQKIFCGFPCQLSRGKSPTLVEVIGNPVREDIFKVLPPQDLIKAGEENRPLRVLVLGGSLGAKALNEVLPETLKLIQYAVQVVHQTGQKQFAETEALYAKAGLKEGFQLLPFLNDMPAAYTWADVVVCRAGALTVSEIAAAGRVGIFIPLPIAVDDHQTKNAKFLMDKGAAKLIPQSQLKPALLASTLDEMNVNRQKLLEMGKAAKALAKPGAAIRVAKELLLSHCPNNRSISETK